MSGVELHELYVSLSLLDKDGSRVATLRKEEPLKAAYYPAEAGIPISLSELKKAGVIPFGHWAQSFNGRRVD